METGSIYAILERSQPPGSFILCFNRRHRITFISKGAQKISLALFGRQLTATEDLPAELKEIVGHFKKNKPSVTRSPIEPPVFFLKDGSPVKPRLAADPANLNHCLIFELEAVISTPEQLKSLGLSSRETEILFWLYQKKTTWEIGKILEVSPRTVEKHIENIFRKLDVNDRESLVTIARQNCDF